MKNDRFRGESSSEGFDGDGTLAYHGNADELASTLSSASSIRLAAWFLALPEMATSLEELLSTNKQRGSLETREPIETLRQLMQVIRLQRLSFLYHYPQG